MNPVSESLFQAIFARGRDGLQTTFRSKFDTRSPELFVMGDSANPAARHMVDNPYGNEPRKLRRGSRAGGSRLTGCSRCVSPFLGKVQRLWRPMAPRGNGARERYAALGASTRLSKTLQVSRFICLQAFAEVKAAQHVRRWICRRR